MKRIEIDYTNMTTNLIGEMGISQEDFNMNLGAIKNAHKIIKDSDFAFRKLPYTDYSDVIEYGKYIRENFDNFLLLGIGGSALGPKAIFRALCSSFHNENPENSEINCYFEDNVDPDRMANLFEFLDMGKTCVNIISKSGKTIETLSQMLIVIDKLKSVLGDKWSDNVVITTDEHEGLLLGIAKQYNIKTFYIPKEVGGRFSIFTPVGLLSAVVCGCDIEEMLKGARDMNELCNDEDHLKNPAYMYGLLQYVSMEKHRNISVMMPYTDSLKFVTDWFSQLWAESLGKKFDLDGNTVNVGQTPVRALGSVDQHSQLQLYMEGPFDKVVTFINIEEFNHELVIPNSLSNLEDLSFLKGQSLNKLIHSELRSVTHALTKNKRSNITINLPKVNEYYLGQLFMMFEIATVFTGYMLNINPFDQPGVEMGKIYTYALLGKEGYESQAKELCKTSQVKFKV